MFTQACMEVHTSTAAAHARACFEELPTHVVAARGRITLQPHAPFWIMSCSGMAAKLLRTSSLRLVGRRLRAFAQPAEIAKLEQATRASMVPGRAYLSLATETGHVHVAIQASESAAGDMQIEVLLFCAEQDACFEEIILDDIPSQDTKEGKEYPDKDLAMSPVEHDDDEVFTGVGTDWAKTEPPPSSTTSDSVTE